MAKIISYEECDAKCMGEEQCPYHKCPEDQDCSSCKNHCPCCDGAEEGLCDQCSEEECANRNKPYTPKVISNEE